MLNLKQPSLLIVLSIIGNILSQPQELPERYVLYDIGNIINESCPSQRVDSFATGINDSGKIVGTNIIYPGYNFNSSAYYMWFSFNKNKFKQLPFLIKSGCGGTGCGPYVNNIGMISGSFCNDIEQSLFVENAELYVKYPKAIHLDSDSEWVESHDTIDYTRINNKQEVVGKIKAQHNKYKVKYINIALNIKKILPIKYSCDVTGINNFGDVVGYFRTTSIPHSFLWNPRSDSLEIIQNFQAASINDQKIIVGTYKNSYTNALQGAVWEKGNITIADDTLDLFNDMTTEIETIEGLNCINNNNEIVGWGKCGNQTRAVLLKKLSYCE